MLGQMQKKKMHDGRSKGGKKGGREGRRRRGQKPKQRSVNRASVEHQRSLNECCFDHRLSPPTHTNTHFTHPDAFQCEEKERLEKNKV